VITPSQKRVVSANGGSALEKYVIRVYRRDPTDPNKMAGTVECGGKQGRKGFLSADALVTILTSPEAMPEKRAEHLAKTGTGKECKSFSEVVEMIRAELEGPEF
jgi:hypothetical protein